MSAPRFLYIIIPRFCGGVKELMRSWSLRLDYCDSTESKIAILLPVEEKISFVDKAF